MRFSILPLDEKSARAILNWKYAPPYDVYNHHPEEMEKDLHCMLDPANGFFGILGAEDGWIGFCSFGKDARVAGGDYAADALDIGLGLSPDRTGKGMGPAVIGGVMEFARRKFHPVGFRVTIASFNSRARRAWEKAGFVEIQRFQRSRDGMAFLILSDRNTRL
jgi:RimJ/RimL family protein N-acetyltransferase